MGKSLIASKSKCEIAEQLLRVCAKMDRFSEAIESLGGSSPKWEDDVFESALDLLGIPPDNTALQNYNRLEANDGYYDDGIYSRDWCYDLWRGIWKEPNAPALFIHKLRAEGVING